jgi:hypothetical protein
MYTVYSFVQTRIYAPAPASTANEPSLKTLPRDSFDLVSWMSLVKSVVSNTADYFVFATIFVLSYFSISLINRENWILKSRLRIEEMSAERGLKGEEEREVDEERWGYSHWEETEWDEKGWGADEWESNEGKANEWENYQRLDNQ